MYRVLASMSNGPVAVTMVNMPRCPYCKALKERLESPETQDLMREAGVQLEIVDMNSEAAQPWIEQAQKDHGQGGFPVLGWYENGQRRTELGLQPTEVIGQVILKAE